MSPPVERPVGDYIGAVMGVPYFFALRPGMSPLHRSRPAVETDRGGLLRHPAVHRLDALEALLEVASEWSAVRSG